MPDTVLSRKVVTIRYTLTDGARNPLDSPEAGRPLTYLEGTGSVVPGLERALHGKRAGDKLAVTVSAADGYGERDPARVRVVPRGRLPDRAAAGTRCRVQVEEGYLPALITALDADGATVDLNHPLAGMTLCFDVEVLAIRDATAEEAAHGHAHGAGAHH